MTTSDTKLNQLIINQLTQAQYDQITPNENELYVITDAKTQVEVDNKSITENASEKIQTVGVIDANNTSNAIKTWTGTQAQYSEIGGYFAYTSGAVPVYVRTLTPTTSSTVYSGIGIASALTIASVSTDSITLSDTNTYVRYGDLDLVDSTQYDATTLYNITDDIGANDCYTKDEVDVLIDSVRRNVGELIESFVPLKDNRVHLLDGALIQRGVYAGFVDRMASLVSEYPNGFTTEENWQTSVSTYGSCGKFVYDSTNNTVRLPKVSDILQGTTDLTALGELIEAGLPNITGSLVGHWNIFAGKDGVFDLLNQQTYTVGGSTTTIASWNTATFDASRSSSIYGNSTTVQPQTIKVLYYIYLANGTNTSIVSNIDNIATDLNGKVDLDFTNVNTLGALNASKWSLPSNSYENLTVAASGSTYTAPANGYVCFVTTTGATQNNYTYLNNETCRVNTYAMGNAAVVTSGYVPVKKGDIFSLGYFDSIIGTFIFIYAEGARGT